GGRERCDTVCGGAGATAGARRTAAIRVAGVARQHDCAGRAAGRVDCVDRRAHLQPVHLLPILMNRAITVLFVVIISLPLAANLAGVDGADPGAEHRELAAWRDGVTNWCDDNFGFRSALVRWYGESRLFGFGVSPSPA